MLVGVASVVSPRKGFVLTDTREYHDQFLTRLAHEGMKEMPIR
jgi:hypothetical protein